MLPRAAERRSTMAEAIGSLVSYEQFGAVGDGVADDMAAICAAHEFANERGLDVRARDDATYYIGGRAMCAIIKTNVNFGTARFIIDDRKLENERMPIFTVDTDYPTYTPEIKTLSKGQRHIDFPHEGRTYVRAFNSEKKIFIRKGANANKGFDTSDCFVVDADGRIESRINYDYPEITRVYARCVEDKPIVIEGGIFTTIANQHERVYKYHYRNFKVLRSNLLIRNMEHYIEGEGDDGAPYDGFFNVSDAVDITIKGCMLTPHKTYLTKDSNETYTNKMGTYEIRLCATVGTRLIGVKQSRDIADTRYWGLICTDYCKDILIEDCVMSRFDAHMGVTNATMKNCSIGHQCLSLIGYGDFYIEGSHILGYAFLALRYDYGCHWEGSFTAKNCVWQPNDLSRKNIVNAVNNGDHDFGYTACMPESIVIDGLRVEDSGFDKETPLYILPDYDPDFAPGKPFPYVPTRKLSVKGVCSDAGRRIYVFAREDEYEGIEINYEV